MMHPSTAEAWPRVAREHEGVLPYPYLDTKGLVTTGVGTLLDDGTGAPPAAFLALPWTVDGQPATRAQAAAGWLLVKSHTELAPKGGHAFRDITRLRIADPVIDGLLAAKTKEFWSVLSAQLPGLEEWPADAQLALIDLSYQLGPRFMGPKWPSFTAAAHADDFETCAEHCSVRQASPGRNAARRDMFLNAAWVVELGLDPARLWYPEQPKEEDDMTPEQMETFAELVAAKLAPLIPSPEEYARKVLTLDGEIENVGIHPKGGDYVTLATAVEYLAEQAQT